MKKLAITLGSIAAAAVPVATAVSCSVFGDDESTKAQGFVSARRFTTGGTFGTKSSAAIIDLKDEVRKNIGLLPGIVKNIQDQETRQYRFDVTFNDGILKFILNINHTGQGIANITEARWDPNNGSSGLLTEAKVSGSTSVINYVNLLFQALMRAPINGDATTILNYLNSNTLL